MAHTKYDRYVFQRSEDERERERFANDMREQAQCKWLAHSGIGGDGGERDTLEQALEASLQYALRYHHGRIAELRAMCFTPAPEAT